MNHINELLSEFKSSKNCFIIRFPCFKEDIYEFYDFFNNICDKIIITVGEYKNLCNCCINSRSAILYPRRNHSDDDELEYFNFSLEYIDMFDLGFQLNGDRCLFAYVFLSNFLCFVLKFSLNLTKI